MLPRFPATVPPMPSCTTRYSKLLNATQHGLVREAEEIDVALARLLRRRVQVGALDANGTVVREQERERKERWSQERSRGEG